VKREGWEGLDACRINERLGNAARRARRQLQDEGAIQNHLWKL
jgi:hypothetical protein